MMMPFKLFGSGVLLAMLSVLGSAALAKLPAPSDEAKSKAAEAAAKTAWGDKVGAYKLCLAQDRVAQVYMTAHKTDAKAPVATPPCADPGPFAYTPAGAASAPPPLEAAGAHSPAKTATGPPSTAAPQAATPVKK